jgi:hypothetical protein
VLVRGKDFNDDYYIDLIREYRDFGQFRLLAGDVERPGGYYRYMD